MAGRRSIIIIIGSINKQIEVVQLDDITVNWKLTGSRLSQIITGLIYNGKIYKPSEVIQLPSLLPSEPHIVKRDGSWMKSLGLYLNPFMI